MVRRLTPLVLLFACSSPPPPQHPKEDAESAVEVRKDADDAHAAKEAKELEPEPARPDDDAPKPAPKPRADDDHEMNYDDCVALADTYGDVWLKDAAAKEPNKDPKLHDAVEQNLRAAAQGARDNWLAACSKVVGSRMPHRNLTCAVKARSLQRFNDCWDGKTE